MSVQAREIPYHEYRIITLLLRAHLVELRGRLKAAIAFGELLVQPDAFDIDLLEIVEGWEDKRFGQFADLPDPSPRGTLRLYFLTPEEFQNPRVIPDPEERQWVEELLNRVRQGYEVVTETDPGWVRRVLDRTEGHSSLLAPPSGSVEFRDPYQLLQKGTSVK